MLTTFRQSMAWLHTWFGLVLGFILMVCFFFGSLSVFDREIDRWAVPSTRFDPQPMPSFDEVLLPAFQRIEPDANTYEEEITPLVDTQLGPIPARTDLQPAEYWAYTTHRDPVLAMGVGFSVPNPKDPDAHNHIHADTTIDPRNGEPLPATQLKLGSEWFYPLHYSLHIEWKNLGIYLVGLAAMAMLAALVSGVVIHRRLLREFFTFRPRKHVQRSTLDLHNLTGVAALPFHFFFAFTGLAVFAPFYYLPVADTVLRPTHLAFEAREAASKGLPHAPSGTVAPMASVDAMVTEAKRRWELRGMPGEVGYLEVHHVGDANATISLYRAGSDQVALVGQAIHFSGTTGEVLYEDPPPSAIGQINEFLTGLHLQHFEHWWLRWLYFLGGLAGCVCIATGFLFFVRKRRREVLEHRANWLCWVEGFAIATVTGMLIATLSMMVANRCLPADLDHRDAWEKAMFFSTWAISALHGIGRSWQRLGSGRSSAWLEQTMAVSVLSLAAAVSNWWSTGDHLGVTWANNWAVAGVDLSLLATAVLSAMVAHSLRKQTKAHKRLADTEPLHPTHPAKVSHV